MQVTNQTERLVYGYEQPSLVAGWQMGWGINRSAKGFAVAVSPDGKTYLIGQTVLYPCGEKLEVDFENTIPIPNQLSA